MNKNNNDDIEKLGIFQMLVASDAEARWLRDTLRLIPDDELSGKYWDGWRERMERWVAASDKVAALVDELDHHLTKIEKMDMRDDLRQQKKTGDVKAMAGWLAGRILARIKRMVLAANTGRWRVQLVEGGRRWVIGGPGSDDGAGTDDDGGCQ